MTAINQVHAGQDALHLDRQETKSPGDTRDACAPRTSPGESIRAYPLDYRSVSGQRFTP